MFLNLFSYIEKTHMTFRVILICYDICLCPGLLFHLKSFYIFHLTVYLSGGNCQKLVRECKTFGHNGSRYKISLINICFFPHTFLILLLVFMSRGYFIFTVISMLILMKNIYLTVIKLYSFY